MELDLFGEPIAAKRSLASDFIIPPFSILDSRSGRWQERKLLWKKRGLVSFEGREENLTFNGMDSMKGRPVASTSIFDPVLCEILYSWFCPIHGKILDPFAGGPVRGLVASCLGFKYTGVDLRVEQVSENIKKAQDMSGLVTTPEWICGDSRLMLDSIEEDSFDFMLSCPPYAFLEKYSDLPEDLSNMSYEDFIENYRLIIKKACSKLKKGSYACFVVGEVRAHKAPGALVGFVPDTIQAFIDVGMYYYNEAILINVIGSAAYRARRYMKNRKLAKVHQNVLIFKKHD